MIDSSDGTVSEVMLRASKSGTRCCRMASVCIGGLRGRLASEEMMRWEAERCERAAAT